eukprot:7405200-Pyramimonas_sp.AAC.1
MITLPTVRMLIPSNFHLLEVQAREAAAGQASEVGCPHLPAVDPLPAAALQRDAARGDAALALLQSA